jgi:hypothetical protein
VTNGQVAYTHLDMVDKGIIHFPGGIQKDGVRFHHTTQTGKQFKIHELLISGIFI